MVEAMTQEIQRAASQGVVQSGATSAALQPDEKRVVEAMAQEIMGEITGKFLRSIDASVFRSFVQTHRWVLDERKDGLLRQKWNNAQAGLAQPLPDP